MSIIKFTETALTGKKKNGILTPDENGYYTMIIGGLNTYNSAGEYYVAKDVLKLFESSSSLMRRIKNGALYAELGHPKKAPGMSMEDFYGRILTIDETNTCAHISEIWLDFNYGKEHPEHGNLDMIAIIAKIKPAGAKLHALESTITDPKQNVAFSVRGITENKYINGRVERSLTQIITFDNVVEPGINIANKWNSPVLESINEHTVNKDLLMKVANSQITNRFATESNKSVCKEVIENFSVDRSVESKLFKW
ncbi:MAG: hypothetical protein ACD_33C00002G0001 [uncultured bacterium]|nr:MAG: hypothetical protein ACD_33C00002G0001 [uncultured bacterium]